MFGNRIIDTYPEVNDANGVYASENNEAEDASDDVNEWTNDSGETVAVRDAETAADDMLEVEGAGAGSVPNVGVGTWNLVRILTHHLGGPPCDRVVGDRDIDDAPGMLLGGSLVRGNRRLGSCWPHGLSDRLFGEPSS